MSEDSSKSEAYLEKLNKQPRRKKPIEIHFKINYSSKEEVMKSGWDIRFYSRKKYEIPGFKKVKIYNGTNLIEKKKVPLSLIKSYYQRKKLSIIRFYYEEQKSDDGITVDYYLTIRESE